MKLSIKLLIFVVGLFAGLVAFAKPQDTCHGKPNFECQYDKYIYGGTGRWNIYDNCKEIKVPFKKDIPVNSEAECQARIESLFTDDGLYCQSFVATPYFKIIILDYWIG